MVDRKAVTPHSDHQTFDVNFYIVQQEFPNHLHDVVLMTLNETEQWAYLNGYMAFTVLSNGLLSWKSTGKLL